jgi:8-oxo-dGTP pyrophosphatase MutT (NUDIX family)
MIIQNQYGHVLLVRHSYVEPDTWMLPSGKMSRREQPISAAQRELREEVECTLSEGMIVEFEDTIYWGRRHTNFIIGGMSDAMPVADLREINEAAFFPLSDLPQDISLPTELRLNRWARRRALSIMAPAFVRLEYVEMRYGHSVAVRADG